MSGDATQSQGTRFFIGASGSPSSFVEILGIKDFTGPGGKTTIIDASTLASTAKEKLPGLPDEGQFTLTGNFISGDAGQLACIAARAARERRQFHVDLPAGAQNPAANPAQSVYFFGYVVEYSQKGGVDKLDEVSIMIEIDGAVTRV